EKPKRPDPFDFVPSIINESSGMQYLDGRRHSTIACRTGSFAEDNDMRDLVNRKVLMTLIKGTIFPTIRFSYAEAIRRPSSITSLNTTLFFFCSSIRHCFFQHSSYKLSLNTS